MPLTLDQINAAIAASDNFRCKLIETKALIGVGFDHRAETRLSSAITAFEALAAAMEIQLVEPGCAAVSSVAGRRVG